MIINFSIINAEPSASQECHRLLTLETANNRFTRKIWPGLCQAAAMALTFVLFQPRPSCNQRAGRRPRARDFAVIRHGADTHILRVCVCIMRSSYFFIIIPLDFLGRENPMWKTFGMDEIISASPPSRFLVELFGR